VELEALLARKEQPLRALQLADDAHELFVAFDKDFGFVRLSFREARAGKPPAADDLRRRRYASLLRAGLRDWRRPQDLRLEKLTAIFVACQTCDIEGGLWALLPDDIAANADLVAYLGELISSFAVSFSAHGGRPPPLWEIEMVETFKKADAAGVELSEHLGVARRVTGC
jgi:hypothetical protein